MPGGGLPVALVPAAARAGRLRAQQIRGRAGNRRGPLAVLTGRYRCTGPERRTISSKVTGGLFWMHLPCDRAPTAKMFQPVPPVAADPGVLAGPAPQCVGAVLVER